MQTTTAFITALIAMLVVDGFWLAVIARGFYQKHIGHLLSSSVDWYAAALFYLIFIGALLYLIVLPALQQNTALLSVAVSGAVFGLVAYATYDLTNQATLSGWSWTVVIVDIVWGAILAAIVSVVAVYITRVLS